MKAVIKALLNSYWAIAPQFATGYSKIAEDILSHKEIGILKDRELSGKAQFLGSSGFLFDEEIEEESEKEGNINVIPVKGVIVKYDTLCEIGTSSMSTMIEDGEKDDSVDFHLLDIDTGGGMVDGTAHFANTIKNAKKPTIAFINGMAASAGYWIASQCDYIISNDQTTMVGSIGTMVMYRDFTEAMAKAGIKDVSIYAEASTHKNQESEELDNNNQKPMINLLNRLNDQFLDAVKTGRTNINQQETLTGKIFVGSEGLDVGLVDEIGTLSTAINKGFSLSNNQFSMENNSKEFMAEVGKFFGLTPKGEVTEKEEKDMAVEQLEAQILTLKSEIEDKNVEKLSLEEQLAAEKQQVEELTAEKQQIIASTNDIVTYADSLKAKVETFEAKEKLPADTEVIAKTVEQSNDTGKYVSKEVVSAMD